MTKTELVEFMAEKAGMSKAEAGRAYDACVEGVTKGVVKEGKVTLTGFVTFAAKAKEAKVGRNPKTGEAVNIPAKTAVVIKAGSKLKEALN